MSEKHIARIYTRKPDSESQGQTTKDLVLSVGGVEVGGVQSIYFGENGSLGPRDVIEATVTLLIRFGSE